MVIFHSYVSLPGGKWSQNHFKKKHPHFTMAAIRLGLRIQEVAPNQWLHLHHHQYDTYVYIYVMNIYIYMYTCIYIYICNNVYIYNLHNYMLMIMDDDVCNICFDVYMYLHTSVYTHSSCAR